MRIALLQDEIFLPSYGGGAKANRLLLEGLARRGHECLAMTRALTSSPDGPENERQFFEQMHARGISARAKASGVFAYEHCGVHVEAVNFSELEKRRGYLTSRLNSFGPDWIIVADDKRRYMLRSALQAAPERVVLLLQTIVHLPFGPLSVDPRPEYLGAMHHVAAMIVISSFARDYMRTYGSLDPHLLHLPIYGDGPFPNLASADSGMVTMINPCPLKGVEIFLALARRHPGVEFAAVPTWGANTAVLDSLRALPNVRILEPSDDIEDILALTRILLVPSLWPETFGYVVPEAMLRGIPVLASNVGGLPEAKLGIDFVLDVEPAEWQAGAFVSPPQDVAPWSAALGSLLSDSGAYDRLSYQSRQAALAFVAGASILDVEEFFGGLPTSASSNRLDDRQRAAFVRRVSAE